MTQLKSATVLITGAAGGFGQMLTRQLLAKGSQLILTDHPSANLSSQLKTLEAEGDPEDDTGNVVACLDIDLSDADKGFYFVNISSKSGSYSSKIILE